MKIKKKVQGVDVYLELKNIKDYARYGLYQVYKLVEGKRIPIYKTCYTKLDIQKIIIDGYCVKEE